MGNVFRYHQGDDTIEDWQSSQAYGRNAIEAIEDPAGATSRREITSIPSPFARIDLVKTAFEHIVDAQELDDKENNNIFHKMVSEAFDIGEILFNLDRFQDKVRLIVWDKKRDLEKLLKSNNRKHRLLGETLQLYLRQDAQANNFDELQRIYLLNYIGGPDPINIIGGTSPVSLFFTSANKLPHYVDIRFGNHRVFGEEHQPLYKRDFEYQKYLYGLRAFFPGGLGRYFKAVDDYLNLNFRKLSDEQREAIRDLNQAEFDSRYEPLSVGNDGNRVELLGYPLCKRVERPTNIEQQSGFVIDSAKYTAGVKPLVLPIDTYTEQVRYTSATWDGHNKAPVYDGRPLNERTLPFDGSKYPYLTISDLLEPYIIRTIYPINKNKFFDGNYTQRDGEVSKGHLLPLKKAYFDFFDTTDLQGVTSDGRKRIEIRQGVAGGVHVTLRIPIQGGNYIAYERTYYPPSNDHEIPQPDEKNNKGAVIENHFNLALYPFVKLLDYKQNNYRVALIDQDILPHTINNKYRLQFHKNTRNEPVNEKAIRSRSEKPSHTVASDYYVIEEDGFDYIQVRHNWGCGIITPLFDPSYQGTSQFTFAIDFGTTNTHIEYRKDGGEPQPFEIYENDVQIATFHDGDNPETLKAISATRRNKLLDIIQQEYIPDLINRHHEFHFPSRTVVGSKELVELNRNVFALADFNIPFVYEKYRIVKPTAVKTNLKWSDYSATSNDVKIIESYFENLLLLIRNKVLLNKGDLAKTKLTWLYPASMTEYRVNLLENTWNRLFKKYINHSHTPLKISESVAPFYYYNRYLNVAARANSVVSIDIGGGTSDVVIYEDDKPRLLTSFRYAANSIFGDAYGRSSKINGFVRHYLAAIKELLRDNKQEELLNVLEDIENTGRSEDIISFFFALERNKKLIEQNVEISFHRKLSLNGDFKIIFLLFYTALIYHIAKMMKAANLKVPRNITFSGTGSKVINIIDGSARLKELGELTKLVFQRVLGEGITVSQINLMQEERPKEISCKGALMIDEEKSIPVESIKKVLLGTTDDLLLPDTAKTYSELDERIERSVLAEYESFLDLFFNLNSVLSFNNKFGVHPADFGLYKSYLTESAVDDLKASIMLKKKELKEDINVPFEETLFFYPLIGGINNLVYKIHQNSVSNV